MTPDYRTPAYRDQSVTHDVNNIYFELYRPSDGAFSEPKAFRYKPSEDVRLLLFIIIMIKYLFEHYYNYLNIIESAKFLVTREEGFSDNCKNCFPPRSWKFRTFVFSLVVLTNLEDLNFSPNPTCKICFEVLIPYSNFLFCQWKCNPRLIMIKSVIILKILNYKIIIFIFNYSS